MRHKSLVNRIKRLTYGAPEARGTTGEARISNHLRWLDFFGKDGYTLRNIYVPKRNGQTTEIDVLYITKKGIFVIESKT